MEAGQYGKLCATFRDSHLNSYVRFKLALTEDEPTIQPYMEILPEAKSAAPEISLSLLDALQQTVGYDVAGDAIRGLEEDVPAS